MAPQAKTVDVVVVGSGWHGLAAAKTYLQVEPDVNLVVLEESSTLGGVWSMERLYPELKSNNMLGTYQYPDFPMEGFDVKPGQHIPGIIVHEYLTKYAKHFEVFPRIQFNTKVTTAEYSEESDQWLLTLQSKTPANEPRADDADSPSSDSDAPPAPTPETTILITKKLICCTGMASDPLIPKIDGLDSFDLPYCHTKDLAKKADDIRKSASSVTVFGGNKAAWDAVYLFASNGIKVDWVIRESGHGPVWMAPAYVTPMKKWLEKLVVTRFLTFMSPCLWGENDGYTGTRKFLHGTWLGRSLVDTFWGILGNDVKTLNKYDKHPETKKLTPWIDAFWVGSALSILNYPTDFFEYVRNGTVKIHIKELTHLTSKTVHLASLDGTETLSINTDALILGTTWKHRPHIQFLPEGIERKLGLPYRDEEVEELSESALGKKADEEILNRFPRLKNQPVWNKNMKKLEAKDKDYTTEVNRPYQLHRFIAPPTNKPLGRSIAFCGMLMNIDTAINAQIQALWAIARLTGKSNVDSEKTDEELQYEACLGARFNRLRYPGGYSERFPDFVFDALPYFDMLLKDVGVENRRKGSFMSEVFTPYAPEDYKDIVEEWLKANSKKEEEKPQEQEVVVG